MHDAFFGLNLNEYRAPRVSQQRYTRTPGIVPVLQKLQKFRVRVCGSYRTYSNSGYGYGSVIELTEVPGIVTRAYRTHISSWQVEQCCTRTPGIVATGVRNLQKFRVRLCMSGRTCRSSGRGNTRVNTPCMLLYYLPYV